MNTPCSPSLPPFFFPPLSPFSGFPVLSAFLGSLSHLAVSGSSTHRSWSSSQRRFSLSPFSAFLFIVCMLSRCSLFVPVVLSSSVFSWPVSSQDQNFRLNPISNFYNYSSSSPLTLRTEWQVVVVGISHMKWNNPLRPSDVISCCTGRYVNRRDWTFPIYCLQLLWFLLLLLFATPLAIFLTFSELQVIN